MNSKNKQCRDCFFATSLGPCLYYYKYTVLDAPACRYFVPIFTNYKKNIADVKNNNRQM